MKRTSEAAIESVLLGAGYIQVDGKGFDRERAIFPAEVLAFIQATQTKTWDKLEALHGAQTGERVLESPAQGVILVLVLRWLGSAAA